MSPETITVNLKCLKCGGIPMTDDNSVTDDSIVKCTSCGEVFGTFADVKAKAVEAVRDDIVTKFKDAFKN